ncbi:Calx-beta domain-containing protein, partial [Maribacter sp. 4U21]|uniref:Calx-beta domain-containing protein n=1 Tax=Maribacter sp. 4U21 TaxID=1889779 RepID=UPI00117E41BD
MPKITKSKNYLFFNISRIFLIHFLFFCNLAHGSNLEKNFNEVTSKKVNPNPTTPFLAPRVELIPSGSLVIPMDNDLQKKGNSALFNLRSYGLLVRLLHANVPLKWAIKTGKPKDGIDFTGRVQRIAPANVATTTRSFRSGPFIVYPGYENEARQVINSYNNSLNSNEKVHVYELKENINIDIKYDFTHKPKAALLDNGGNADIHQQILIDAGLIENIHYFKEGINAEDLKKEACYTFVSEAHADEDNVSKNAVDNIKKFVQDGGNFFGQCAGGRAYENIGLKSNRLITKDGVTDPGIDGNIIFSNADSPVIQIHGGLSDEGGSAPSYKTNSFDNGADIKIHAYDSGDRLNYKVYGGRIGGFKASKGGHVHYLGGHNYDNGSNMDINGQRIYLNAYIMPSQRSLDCNIDISVSGPIEIEGFRVNENTGTTFFRVTSRAQTSGPFSANYRVTNGSARINQDYTLNGSSGTLNFSGRPGETIDIPLRITDDAIIENTEDLFVTITSVT